MIDELIADLESRLEYADESEYNALLDELDVLNNLNDY